MYILSLFFDFSRPEVKSYNSIEFFKQFDHSIKTVYTNDVHLTVKFEFNNVSSLTLFINKYFESDSFKLLSPTSYIDYEK
ncbi:hypothetical protein [Capybara microvirus Cap1_SP_64]|nr:hypothetical protein [Capybara microvirus Cap1_SP_64]